MVAPDEISPLMYFLDCLSLYVLICTEMSKKFVSHSYKQFCIWESMMVAGGQTCHKFEKRQTSANKHYKNRSFVK